MPPPKQSTKGKDPPAASLSVRLRARLKRLGARLSLRAYVTCVVMVAVIAACALAGYSAFDAMYRKALDDTWAILFQEGEKVGDRLAEAVRAAPGFTGMRAPKDAEMPRRAPDLSVVLGKDGAFKVSNGYADELPNKPNATLRTAIGRPGKPFVTAFGKQPHVVIAGGKGFKAWRLDLGGVVGAGARGVVVATSSGEILFASDGPLTPDDFNRRPLAQRFIKSGLNHAQLEFEDEHGVPSYGYFRQVPGTNLVLFKEQTKAGALADVRRVAMGYAKILALIVVLVGVSLQFPLSGVTRPVKELVILANEISRGNFAVRPKLNGFGELSLLLDTFSSMAGKLISRDDAIRKLMVEQREKVRIEAELAVAKGLQDNFLPQGALPEASGLEIASCYSPASQVAGDWFNFDYNDATGETLIVIADVSGHDMASSMFTAMIATLFFDLRDSSRDRPFPVPELAARIGSGIFRFGKGKWHATVQIIRYVRGESEVEVTNCGHTFPLLMAHDGAQPLALWRIPSTPLGLSLLPEAITRTERRPFAPGDALILYTDGLIEARQENGRLYGVKRLRAVGQAMRTLPIELAVQNLKSDCETYVGKRPRADDLCIVGLRRRA